jgi:hypothetical protein
MATARLPMRKAREILRQKLLCGLSHRQVVQSVGVSAGSVGDVMSRAKARVANLAQRAPGDVGAGAQPRAQRVRRVLAHQPHARDRALHRPRRGALSHRQRANLIAIDAPKEQHLRRPPYPLQSPLEGRDRTRRGRDPPRHRGALAAPQWILLAPRR